MSKGDQTIKLEGHEFKLTNFHRLRINVTSQALWMDGSFEGYLFLIRYKRNDGQFRYIYEFSSLGLDTMVSKDIGDILRELIKRKS